MQLKMDESLNLRIAIASGKGGTGKTLVSTNLFRVLESSGYHTTLVDCDAEEPNDILFFEGKRTESVEVMQKIPVIDEGRCLFCGKCHEYCSYNAIFFLSPLKIIRVIDDLCHGCGACSVACSCGAISEKAVSLGTVNRYICSEKSVILEAEMKVGVYSPVPVIKAAIARVDSKGVILIDSAPGTSCPFIQTVAAADYVILVTEPTPFGMCDLKQSVETLKTLHKTCGVIVNRSGIGDNAVYAYLEEENIPLLMEIPYDRAIASYYSKGDLAVRYMPVMERNFTSMFGKIVEYYGNSSYQR